jgi:hypothetical protein
MPNSTFPALKLSEWFATRDTLHLYCKVLGKIRRALAPPQKHWWHISLGVTAQGLTTTAIPIPLAGAATFEMLVDLQQGHRLTISTSRGEIWQMPLTGQPVSEFCDAVLAALAQLGIPVEIDRSLFADNTARMFDFEATKRYGQVLVSVDHIFKQFKAELPGETSPVQLWPHHFDLSLVWFSGRKVPGIDPTNEEYADEQMGFGFSTGDEGIPGPYFYAMVYPWPENIVATPLPTEATWYTQSWKGALLPYAALTQADSPETILLDYLRAAYEAGSARMRCIDVQ